MKRLTWLVPILFLWYGLQAQTTAPGFVILNPASVTNLSDFVQALKINNLDNFRHVNHRTTIHFNEGLNVQLLSGIEMVEAGLPVDMSRVNTTTKDRTLNKQFSLHSSGRIIITAFPLNKGQ